MLNIYSKYITHLMALNLVSLWFLRHSRGAVLSDATSTRQTDSRLQGGTRYLSWFTFG